ncbi:MAG: peptidoglycan DD-metalloendopeptidase family protein [Treponema sp.]|nr:peptidoglycan DD-metalloendopeptidase family protein [Treponema sp.]
MNKKKTITLTVFSIFLAGIISAFDWPQNETEANSFFSYFGQMRGGRIGSSLIFNENSAIKATDTGKIAIIITEHNNDFGWFESTLGNSIIITHDNGLQTVYGNLEAENLNDGKEQTITSGTNIGQSGNSGWQEGQSCMEFKVIDLKNKAAINPRLLMPRIGKELQLTIEDLSLEDKDGKIHYLVNERSFVSGTYSLYRTRQEIAMPYKTNVSINGTTVENISYDKLEAHNGKLCAIGNKNYPVNKIYPDSKRQLLAVIHLTKGHSTLSVTLSDILGATRSITYNIDIN